MCRSAIVHLFLFVLVASLLLLPSPASGRSAGDSTRTLGLKREKRATLECRTVHVTSASIKRLPTHAPLSQPLLPAASRKETKWSHYLQIEGEDGANEMPVIVGKKPNLCKGHSNEGKPLALLFRDSQTQVGVYIQLGAYKLVVYQEILVVEHAACNLQMSCYKYFVFLLVY